MESYFSFSPNPKTRSVGTNWPIKIEHIFPSSNPFEAKQGSSSVYEAGSKVENSKTKTGQATKMDTHNCWIPLCVKSYGSYGALSRHMKDAHGIVAKAEKKKKKVTTKKLCTKCGNTFKDGIALGVHTTHSHPAQNELKRRIKEFHERYE